MVVGSMHILDQRLGCHRAVLCSRQFSQTSAGVWHPAHPQQRPGVHEGALASEAGDMCRNPCFPLPVFFEESAPDGAEQAAAPGVVHIDVGAPWRDEEAAFGDFFCVFLAHNVVFFGHFTVVVP